MEAAPCPAPRGSAAPSGPCSHRCAYLLETATAAGPGGLRPSPPARRPPLSPPRGKQLGSSAQGVWRETGAAMERGPLSSGGFYGTRGDMKAADPYARLFW